MNNAIAGLLIVISGIGFIAITSDMDLADAELAERQYCQNVNAKLWAQFKTNVNCDEIGEEYE